MPAWTLVALLGCAASRSSEGDDLTRRSGVGANAPVILLRYVPENSTRGQIQGVGPGGTAYAGEISLPVRSEADRVRETGAVEPGTEVGAQVFSPFPESWPQRGKNTVEAVRVRLGDDEGNVLECVFQIRSPDEGIRPPFEGTCRDEEGLGYRARVE